MIRPDYPFHYHRFRQGHWEEIASSVPVEANVSLAVNGVHWLTFLCTPIDLKALSLGFLFNEGIISSVAEVALVDACALGNHADVWLNHSVEKPVNWQRTSGCSGGFTAIIPEGVEPLSTGSGLQLPPERIMDIMGIFLESQSLYRQTGGVHSSALSDGETICIKAEDIGRHNTLDKIAGQYLMNPFHTEQRILLTTGRISSEMLLKGARMRASILISRSAVNSTSIQQAQLLGITLIGYSHRNEFCVYAHPERLIGFATLNPPVDTELPAS
jgi:FdhD protein